MLIIPLSIGYMVTDGFSWARTFSDREAAIAFSFQMELYYPRMSIYMRFPVKGTLYEGHTWR